MTTTATILEFKQRLDATVSTKATKNLKTTEFKDFITRRFEQEYIKREKEEEISKTKIFVAKGGDWANELYLDSFRTDWDND